MTERLGLFGSLILLALLVSCAPPPAVSTTATPAAPTLAAPSASPTATVQTAAPSPTPPPTQPSSATPDPSVLDVTITPSTSPDGAWTAVTTVAIPKPDSGQEQYYQHLQVEGSDGSTRWTAVDQWSPYGLGYTTPRPFHWSSDGRYLYFTDEPVPDGCALFVNGSDLNRLDLTTGEVTTLVPQAGPWISLSPDEHTLAYVAGGDRGLVLRDLATGQEQAIPLQVGSGDWQAGDVIWSPDGSSLALTVAHGPCRGGWAQSTSILRVDLARLEATPLLQEDNRLLLTAAWPDAATIVVQNQNGQRLELNAETGQVATSTETGTLQGKVTIGPTSPVVRADEPSPTVPPEAYAARRIVVYAADGQTEVIRVPIQPDGTYQVQLAPGSYVVDIDHAGMDSARGLPVKLTIVAGQTTTLDIDIDTGIR